MNTKFLICSSRALVFWVFCLIFVGGLVTSWQAGMAVPDWPLSFGSLNPDGWWANFPVRLEHGHRLIAASVGLLVGILCALVWGNGRALIYAAIAAVIAPAAGHFLGAEPWMMAHLGVWPAALLFVCALFSTPSKRVQGGRSSEEVLALAGFVLVCCQATLGGLRVTRETAGAIDVALVLRIAHACVAQAFLVILVALSARLALSSGSQGGLVLPAEAVRASLRWTWLALGAVYLQLIVGATMRHLGAGLAIPTFPEAAPDGGWIPQVHNLFTDLNFTHTRVGALVVSIVVLVSSVLIIRLKIPVGPLRFAGLRNALLVGCQVALGVLVIWHQKPRTLATLHVVLGAALLASLAATLVRLKSAASAEGKG